MKDLCLRVCVCVFVCACAQGHYAGGMVLLLMVNMGRKRGTGTSIVALVGKRLRHGANMAE